MNAPKSISLVPMVLLALAARSAAQDSAERARKLFVTNCATCHGESGDGKGTTQLDRPARSFMDGGFSFGNTPEQLFKTISTGIPGSPMPGFDSSLSEEERKLVADYVVTLGPPIEEVKEEDMILVVHDRPLVVRGKLPALAEGLPEHPRGLLIGDPSGITFEYTVDDVRLLALRQGGFVKRTDWSGRGGTPLEPLGKVVHLVEGGKPQSLFSLAGGAIPLQASLSSTRAGNDAMIEYHLVREGREVAHVSETPHVAMMPFGTGYARQINIVAGRERVHLALIDATQGPGEELLAKEIKNSLFAVKGHMFVSVRKSPDRSVEFRLVLLPEMRWSRKGGVLIVELEPGQSGWVGVGTIPLAEWNDTVRKQVEQELP